MELCKLDCSETALLAGCGRIRQLIREGHRSLDCETIAAIVADLGLEIIDQPSRGLLLIEAIDHRPALRDAAAMTLDWVDRFDGDDPSRRRQLREPGDWERVLHAELRAAADSLTAAGLTDILIGGAMRLSIGLATGAALRGVAGFSVATRNPLTQQEWGSSGTVSPGEYTLRETTVSSGPDVALALAVSGDPSEDVEAYLRRDHPEVGRLITLLTPGGPGRHAVADGSAARGARSRSCRDDPPDRPDQPTAPAAFVSVRPVGAERSDRTLVESHALNDPLRRPQLRNCTPHLRSPHQEGRSGWSSGADTGSGRSTERGRKAGYRACCTASVLRANGHVIRVRVHISLGRRAGTGSRLRQFKRVIDLSVRGEDPQGVAAID